ncbi:Glycosylphosphatidylinositol (GPI) anchor assembly protein [Apophysomyces sp. BC1034]|nr:Glycosylphosphatidylinositol (GPI) anchor assembly protein [Apophysomyces sp. BC1015]KAG0169553.1 Glycosylphosphatidylinositol (GPI) anchor assembly protein [Apophysomyces sp. BC1021]KAG0188228.1 Glycosylphosphatidylinositol (GPI) anchor assembly protein [Apophysomyces sp. BC1034]
MSPFSTELVVAMCAVAINYGATFRFPATELLKDPVTTLSTAVPTLLIAHLSLVVLALALRRSLQHVISSLGYTLVAIAAATGVIYGLTVLFGAPLLTKFYHTLAFSAYLAILSVVPAFAILAPTNVSNWIKVFVQHCPSTRAEIYAYTQVVCTLSGAWIGAIVLPLDWERDWQAWPISCIISTFLGHVVGVIAGFGWTSFKYVFSKKKNE